MQFFKVIISSLLVAAAIAAPAPEANSRPVEARVPEFGNVEPLMAELISRAAEVEGTLEARAPILCDIACKGSVRNLIISNPPFKRCTKSGPSVSLRVRRVVCAGTGKLIALWPSSL